MGEHMNKSKGTIKQVVGGLTGNDKLKREGKRDEAKGRVEGAVNDVKGQAKQVKKSIKQIPR